MSLKERLRLEEIESESLLMGARLPKKDPSVEEAALELAIQPEETKKEAKTIN